MDLTFTLQPEPAPEERNRIIDPLAAYNESQAGPRNKKESAFSVHSETGEFVGGLLGFTHWNHFFVSAVFVDEKFRREGIGRELLQRAEALALQQGCDTIYLDTFDFQAPGFYEKLGFRVFGKLEDYPAGHQRFYLVKQIRRRRKRTARQPRLRGRIELTHEQPFNASVPGNRQRTHGSLALPTPRPTARRQPCCSRAWCRFWASGQIDLDDR